MATNKLTAQVVPSFATGQVATTLTIRPDAGFYADTDTHLVLIPAVGATIVCDVGSLRTGNTKPVDISGGIVSFSGGDTTSLPAIPVYSNPLFNVLFAFDGETGAPIGVNVSYDPVTQQLRASRKCYAAVAYTPYQSSGLEIIYSAKIDTFGSGGAQRSTYGVIAAFYPPNNMTTYQIQPQSIENGNAQIELYRIVSNKVTTSAGEFEMPVGFPANTGYPGKSLTINKNSYIQHEAVHEIGYMDSTGRGWVTSYSVPKAEPYVGDNTYKVPLICKISTLSTALYPSELILRAKAFVASKNLGCKP